MQLRGSVGQCLMYWTGSKQVKFCHAATVWTWVHLFPFCVIISRSITCLLYFSGMDCFSPGIDTVLISGTWMVVCDSSCYYNTSKSSSSNNQMNRWTFFLTSVFRPLKTANYTWNSTELWLEYSVIDNILLIIYGGVKCSRELNVPCIGLIMKYEEYVSWVFFKFLHKAI